MTTTLERRDLDQHVEQLRQGREGLLAAEREILAKLPEAEADEAEYGLLEQVALKAYCEAEAAVERSRAGGTLVGAQGEILGYPGQAKSELRDRADALRGDHQQVARRHQQTIIALNSLRCRLSQIGDRLRLVGDQLGQAEVRLAAQVGQPDGWLSRARALLPGRAAVTAPAQPTARQAKAAPLEPAKPKRTEAEVQELERFRAELAQTGQEG